MLLGLIACEIIKLLGIKTGHERAEYHKDWLLQVCTGLLENIVRLDHLLTFGVLLLTENIQYVLDFFFLEYCFKSSVCVCVLAILHAAFFRRTVYNYFGQYAVTWSHSCEIQLDDISGFAPIVDVS